MENHTQMGQHTHICFLYSSETQSMVVRTAAKSANAFHNKGLLLTFKKPICCSCATTLQYLKKVDEKIE
ncbi:MAG: hypothetical protein FRX49_09818 [Trebouxia sp. A1-2]|nr:MAG: hypothetical protein FRX49_09818 [Trebouxia sp. A1-2]